MSVRENNVSEEAQFSNERESGSSDKDKTQSLDCSNSQISVYLNDYLLLNKYDIPDSYASDMKSDHSTD